MVNYFEQFVKDELEWICNDDMINILLEGFDGEITEDELDEHLEEFMNQSVEGFCNDEWIIQTMHDWMHDFMVDAIKDYLNSKEN